MNGHNRDGWRQEVERRPEIKNAVHALKIRSGADAAVTNFDELYLLDQILPLVDDPDAGVRRALLMAIRNVPSDALGDSLQIVT